MGIIKKRVECVLPPKLIFVYKKKDIKKMVRAIINDIGKVNSEKWENMGIETVLLKSGLCRLNTKKRWDVTLNFVYCPTGWNNYYCMSRKKYKRKATNNKMPIYKTSNFSWLPDRKKKR